MSRTANNVLSELLALTPPGSALPLRNADGAMWPVWLAPLAAEISRFEGLAEEMLLEIDPREAIYFLSLFEQLLGPDPYGRDQQPLTIAQRQQLAYSRYTQKWGATPADFIAFAATFGVAITITEYTLTTCGESRIGDTLTCAPEQFTWVVNLPPAQVEYATCDASAIGDYLDEFAPSLVQPAIAGRAPAHTTPVFNYA